MLPDEKKGPMNDEVKEIENRMEILKKTDGRLEFILDFNKRLAAFNQVREAVMKARILARLSPSVCGGAGGLAAGGKEKAGLREESHR